MTSTTLLTARLEESRLGNLLAFSYEYEFCSQLKSIWPKEPPPPAPVSTQESAANADGPKILFSRRMPEPTAWKVAFTPSFLKSIAGIDKTLQGRVLGALGELSEQPASSKGDTIKPLIGGLKGLWRYRIGDYRLIYEPQSASKIVVLLEFSARGGAYD